MVSPTSGSPEPQSIQPTELTESTQASQLTQKQAQEQIDETSKQLGNCQTQLDEIGAQMQAGTLPPFYGMGKLREAKNNLIKNIGGQ